MNTELTFYPNKIKEIKVFNTLIPITTTNFKCAECGAYTTSTSTQCDGCKGTFSSHIITSTYTNSTPFYDED